MVFTHEGLGSRDKVLASIKTDADAKQVVEAIRVHFEKNGNLSKEEIAKKTKEALASLQDGASPKVKALLEAATVNYSQEASTKSGEINTTNDLVKAIEAMLSNGSEDGLTNEVNTQNVINWLSNAPDAIKKLIPEPPEGQSNEENALSGNDKGIVAFIGGILGAIIDGKELEKPADTPPDPFAKMLNDAGFETTKDAMLKGVNISDAENIDNAGNIVSDAVSKGLGGV